VSPHPGAARRRGCCLTVAQNPYLPNGPIAVVEQKAPPPFERLEDFVPDFDEDELDAWLDAERASPRRYS
jgi:hypothetical protein